MESLEGIVEEWKVRLQQRKKSIADFIGKYEIGPRGSGHFSHIVNNMIYDLAAVTYATPEESSKLPAEVEVAKIADAAFDKYFWLLDNFTDYRKSEFDNSKMNTGHYADIDATGTASDVKYILLSDERLTGAKHDLESVVRVYEAVK